MDLRTLLAGRLETEGAIRVAIGICDAVPGAARPAALFPGRILVDADDKVTIGPLAIARFELGYIAPELASPSGMVVSELVPETAVQKLQRAWQWLRIRYATVTRSPITFRWRGRTMRARLTPEGQIRRAALEPRATVFAVGAILWEMLAGRPLFAGDTHHMTIELVRAATIPPLATAPPALEEIVRKALAKEPAERYPTVDELRLALTAYLAR